MKRVLTVLLVLCMVLSLIPLNNIVAFAYDSPEITSYGFISNGTVVNSLTNQTTLSAYADIQNTNRITDSKIGELVIASYITADGIQRLLDIKSTNISLESNIYSKRVVTSTIDVPSDPRVSYKVFVMDDLQNLSPIRPVVYLNNSNPISDQVKNDAQTYASEINTDVGLNLLKGYNDVEFNSLSYVSRDVFTADLIRFLGKQNLANMAKGPTAFGDVSGGHWASGYINALTGLGYISGYEDGLFYPNKNITYYEAVKVLVNVLGYKPLVNTQYNEVIGYMDVAGNYGITNGINMMPNDLISAGAFAKLIYNCLDIPLVEQVGFGSTITYVIQDGYGDTTRKTIMSERLNIVKLQVVVNSSSLFASNYQGSESVEAIILNNYKTKYSYEFESGMNVNINVGTTDLSSYVGYKVTVYALYNESTSTNPVALYFVNDTVGKTISTSNIGDIYSDGYSTIIEYYENPSDIVPQKAELSDDTNIYINGVRINFSTVRDILNAYGEVELVRLNADCTDDYDTIFVTDYTDVVVDSIDTVTYRIYAKNDARSISFNPQDTSITAFLYDENGIKMNWADLKEWDVLSVKVAQTYNKTVYKARLVKNTVQGKITAVKDYVAVENVKYEINGTDYMLDPKGMTLDNLYLGDEGTFYLDQLGRIAWYDTTPKILSNYAYIENIVPAYGLTGQPEMKVFTKDDSIKILKLANYVKIDGVGGLRSADMFDASETPCNLVKSISQADFYAIVDRFGGDNLSYLNGTVTINAVVPGEFITFETNSNNEVVEIHRATCVSSTYDVSGKFTQYGAANQASTTYTQASKSFNTTNGRVYLTDKTVIMVAPINADSDDDYYMTNPGLLIDDQYLENVTFYNVDGNKNVDAILVRTDPGLPHETTDPSPIVKTTTAYIQNIVPVSGITPQPEMKVLDIDGTFKEYKVAETVKIDGVEGLRSRDMFDASECAMNLTKAMTQTEYDSIVSANGGGFLFFANGVVTVDAVTPSDFAVLKINSNNEVAEIDRATVVSNTTDVENKFTQYGVSNATVTYNQTNKSLTSALGTVYADYNTRLFFAAPQSLDDEDYAVCDITKIPNGQTLNNVKYLNVNSNKTAGVILVESTAFMPEMPIIENPAVSSTTAYIQNIVPGWGLSFEPEMKVFNKNGEFVVYKVAPTVKIDGVGGLKSRDMFDAIDWPQDMAKVITQTEYNNIVATNGEGYLSYSGGVVTIKAVMPSDFVVLGLDSNNCVVEIDRATTVTDTANVSGKFTQYGPVGQFSEYSSSDSSFSTSSGLVYATDQTVIMVAPSGSYSDDDYFIFKPSMLENGQIFNDVAFYNVDVNKNVGYLLVKSEPDIISEPSFLAVSGYNEISNQDGQSAYMINGLQNGASVYLPTVPSSEINPPNQGQIISPVNDMAGEVKRVDLLADLDTTANIITAASTALSANVTPFSKNIYYFGKIKEIRGRNVTLFDDAQSVGAYGLDIATMSTTNVYVYDERIASFSQRVSIQDINYVDARIATQMDEGNGYSIGDTIYEDSGMPISSMSIFAREYNGKTTDVMLYIFR